MPKDIEWIGPKPRSLQQQAQPPQPVEVPKSIPDQPIQLTYKFTGTSNGRAVETIELRDIKGIKKNHMVVVAIDSQTKKQLATKTVPIITEEDQ